MLFCSNQHPPIVHEERDCPLCETLRQLDNNETILSDLEKQYETLQEAHEDLKSKIYPHLPELFL